MRGQAYPAINDSDFAVLPFPLPPLAEQHRIVAKMDELMALCDRLEAAQAERENRRDKLAAASLHRLNRGPNADEFREHARFHLRHLPRLTTRPDHIQQLRQTILNLAVSGKLVPQDPNDEPASQLASRARRARREALGSTHAERARVQGKNADGRQPKYVLPKPPLRGPTFDLPIGWAWVAWREVGICQNGRAFPSTNYSDSGIRLLRPGNLFADGSVVWTDNNTRFLPEIWAEEYPRFVIGGSEIVMNLTAQSLKDAFLGRACLTGEGERCLLNQRIARLTSYATNPRYSLWLLKSAAFRDYVDGGLNQGALIQHMFTAQVDEFEFPLPPLAEQGRIVAKVEELMALCDQMEAQLTVTQSESHRLLEAVLHEALSGAG